MWTQFSTDTQMFSVAFGPLSPWTVWTVQLDVTLGNDLFQPLAFRCVERASVLEAGDLVCPSFYPVGEAVMVRL